MRRLAGRAARLVGVALAASAASACATPPATLRARALTEARARPRCEALIAKYGLSRPGSVSLDEFGRSVWDVMRGRLDSDGDGRVSEAEFNAPFVNAPDYIASPVRKAFHALDRGRMGYVDEADVRRDEAPYFSRQDSNHDGWMSVEECVHYVPAPFYFG